MPTKKDQKAPQGPKKSSRNPSRQGGTSSEVRLPAGVATLLKGLGIDLGSLDLSPQGLNNLLAQAPAMVETRLQVEALQEQTAALQAELEGVKKGFLDMNEGIQQLTTALTPIQELMNRLGATGMSPQPEPEPQAGGQPIYDDPAQPPQPVGTQPIYDGQARPPQPGPLPAEGNGQPVAQGADRAMIPVQGGVSPPAGGDLMGWVQMFMQMMNKGESAPQQPNPGESIAGAVEFVSSIFTAMGKIEEVMEASRMRFLKNIKLAQGIQISEVTPPTEPDGGGASE